MKKYPAEVWISRDRDGGVAVWSGKPTWHEDHGMFEEGEEDADDCDLVELFLLGERTFPPEAYPAPCCARAARLVLEVE